MSTRALAISPDLSLPLDTVTSTLIVYGGKGMGKTNLGSDYEPLPVGEDLQQYWYSRLPEGESKILKILVRHRGNPVDRELLDEQTGYKRSSRDAYLSRLAARRLVEVAGAGQVRASANLFEGL